MQALIAAIIIAFLAFNTYMLVDIDMKMDDLQRGVDGLCGIVYPLTQDPHTIWQPTGRIMDPTPMDQR